MGHGLLWWMVSADFRRWDALSWSWPTSVHACRVEQFRQPLPRMEHTRFHGVLGDTDDLGGVADSGPLIVDEIDNLPVHRRKSRQAVSQDIASLLLLDRDLPVAAGVLDRGRRHLLQLIRVSM
jgi:hypothetical protein